MSTEDEKLKELQDELQWISYREQSFSEKLKSKGVFGVLVPLGCLTTLGILANGFYHMIKQNSQKQQTLMRYRVLAQGATLGISIIGIYSFAK